MERPPRSHRRRAVARPPSSTPSTPRLYHSLLFPNIVSDVNGRYAGSDGKVHTAHGREEYANFSEWDIYRSEIQLESLLDPHAVGDMVQSLVDDARADRLASQVGHRRRRRRPR